MRRKDILADMKGCGVYLFVKVDEDKTLMESYNTCAMNFIQVMKY